MRIGDTVRIKLSGETGKVLYTVVIEKNVPCGDGAIGSWGVALLEPNIWREGMLTEHHKSWFNGLFYDYWIVLLDGGGLARINDSKIERKE